MCDGDPWLACEAPDASGDLGFTAGTYDFAFKGPDGKPTHEKGKYLCTWRKEKDGTWKVAGYFIR